MPANGLSVYKGVLSRKQRANLQKKGRKDPLVQRKCATGGGGKLNTKYRRAGRIRNLIQGKNGRARGGPQSFQKQSEKKKGEHPGGTTCSSRERSGSMNLRPLEGRGFRVASLRRGLRSPKTLAYKENPGGGPYEQLNKRKGKSPVVRAAFPEGNDEKGNTKTQRKTRLKEKKKRSRPQP